MGAKSKRKGKLGELEAAAELRRVLGIEARRGRQNKGADDSPDVITTLSGVHFEVKRCEKLWLYKALEQAALDAGANIPVVLHRPNNQPWIAIVRLDDLPKLAMQVYLALSEHNEPAQSSRTSR